MIAVPFVHAVLLVVMRVMAAGRVEAGAASAGHLGHACGHRQRNVLSRAASFRRWFRKPFRPTAPPGRVALRRSHAGRPGLRSGSGRAELLSLNACAGQRGLLGTGTLLGVLAAFVRCACCAGRSVCGHARHGCVQVPGRHARTWLLFRPSSIIVL